MYFSTRKKLNYAFGSAWLTLIFLGAMTYAGLQNSNRESLWLSHTSEVLTSIAQLQAHINELDSVHRVFILSGPDFQRPFTKDLQPEIIRHFAELDRLVQDNPEQRDRVTQYRELVAAKKAFFDVLVLARTKDPSTRLSTAENFVQIDENMANLDRIANQMMESEKILQNLRSKNARESNQIASILVGLGTLIASLILVFARKSLRNELNLRMRSERAAKDSQERFMFVAKATQDTVWDWALTTNHIWWNDGINRFFGYERDDVKESGDWWVDKIHAMDKQRILDDIHNAIEDKNILNWQGEYRFRKKDGSYRHVFDRGYLLRDEEGKAIRMIGSMIDLTEMKDLEFELIQAREKAVAASQLKSEFLANMSHEIRTPMNGVIGMTGLLLDTELDSLQKDFAETIRSCADSLLVVINDILDFSKIEAGKLNIESSDFELRTVVESCMDLLAPEAHAKGLEFVSFINPELPSFVVGDSGRLRQMITNLLGNAIKFTQSGEVLIEVNKGLSSDGDPCLRFEIIDTGIGISEEHQSKLFQAFSQADGSTARKYGGTGLGLAISRQLATLMGGEMGVRSGKGKGSTFWFTLPLIEAKSQSRKESIELTDLRGRRCLVVDDNPNNRRILNYQIVSWGMRAGDSLGPKEALETLKRAAQEGDPYDLVVLDMHMPEMDGIEFARIVRADKILSSTRIILMSSVAQAVTAEELQSTNISLVLTKPVRQLHLYHSFLEAMSGFKPALKTKAAPARPIVSLLNKRVLVVEDNPINQRIALSLLEKLGYKAEAVGNGIEALEASARIAYDVILMDCQMPEMDGYEATRALREREGGDQHTVVIAMTANAVEGDREKCLDAGMDDYIGKPVNITVLKATLENWMNQERRGTYS